jgi:hypothetical protein
MWKPGLYGGVGEAVAGVDRERGLIRRKRWRCPAVDLADLEMLAKIGR